MIRALVDTNAYAAFKRGDQEAVRFLRHADRIGMSVVVLGELMAGFAVGSQASENRAALDAFLESARVVTLPIDAGTCQHYALIYQRLRAKGRPVPTNDMWIAASAMQHGYGVFTCDGHFSEIDGLPVGSALGDFVL